MTDLLDKLHYLSCGYGYLTEGKTIKNTFTAHGFPEAVYFLFHDGTFLVARADEGRYLRTGFNLRYDLEPLVELGVITEQEKEEYKKEHSELVAKNRETRELLKLEMLKEKYGE